jgi:hypothetical protein
VVVSLFVIGFVLQLLNPSAKSIGDVIQSHIIGEIRNLPDMTFDPERIASIEVTHRKWQFRR